MRLQDVVFGVFLSSLEANFLCARENNILRQTEQKITKRLNYFRFMTYFYDFCFRPKAAKIYCFFSISRNVCDSVRLKETLQVAFRLSRDLGACATPHFCWFQAKRRKYGKSVMCEIIYQKARKTLHLYAHGCDGKDMNIFATFPPSLEKCKFIFMVI